METLLYLLARAVVALLQALPLPWVARLGWLGGGVCYWCDARHRRAALANLQRCFGSEKTSAEIQVLARENFRRIGENFASAVKTASMTLEELSRHVELIGTEKIVSSPAGAPSRSRIVAIGHFGNFELYTFIGRRMSQFKPATTYRGLKHRSLSRLMQSLRTQSGCRFFERRTESEALRAALNSESLLLGLLADQHAGERGLQLPFLGQECSTTAAPALFALRYRCPLYTSICYRIGSGRWRIEIGDEIPTCENGRARSVAAITLEINQAFEAAVKRDPANWFWVHSRWKPAKRTPRNAPPPPYRSSGA